MTNIVSSTLDFSKPVAPKLSPCDVHRLIVDTLELRQDSLFQRVVTLTFDFDESQPLIPADAAKLQNVFLHVFRNAYKALSNKGTIHCRTRTISNNHTSAIEICISDTFVGIPREDLAMIITPFFSRKTVGLGLGLTVSKRMIEHHHASMNVQSTRGKGSTVCLTFPVTTVITG